MLALAIKQYWCQITLILIAAIGAMWVQSLRVELVQSQSKLSQYQYALKFQNEAIEAQRIDAERLKNLPKTVERIKTRYITVYQDIEAIKDDNATILIDRLNSFQY